MVANGCVLFSLCWRVWRVYCAFAAPFTVAVSDCDAIRNSVSFLVSVCDSFVVPFGKRFGVCVGLCLDVVLFLTFREPFVFSVAEPDSFFFRFYYADTVFIRIYYTDTVFIPVGDSLGVSYSDTERNPIFLRICHTDAVLIRIYYTDAVFFPVGDSHGV